MIERVRSWKKQEGGLGIKSRRARMRVEQEKAKSSANL